MSPMAEGFVYGAVVATCVWACAQGWLVALAVHLVRTAGASAWRAYRQSIGGKKA